MTRCWHLIIACFVAGALAALITPLWEFDDAPSPDWRSMGAPSKRGDQLWSRHARNGWQAAPDRESVRRMWNLTVTRLEAGDWFHAQGVLPEHDVVEVPDSLVIEERGWPLRSLVRVVQGSGAASSAVMMVHGVVDALVFSIALIILTFGSHFVYQRLHAVTRVPRGRCPKCNYDLRGNRGGDKGCSECGWGR